jgi:hypothetical protein
MLSNVYKELECPICVEKYGNTEVKPLNFWICGHSVCDVCVASLYVSAPSSNGGKVIKCPNCKTPHNVTKKSVSFNLPVNYALLKIIDACALDIQQEKNPLPKVCLDHKQINNKICLDPRCTKESSTCTRCLENHKDCEMRFLVEQSVSANGISFGTYVLKNDEIDKVVNNVYAGYVEKITSVLNNIKKKLKECLNVYRGPIRLSDFLESKTDFKIAPAKVCRYKGNDFHIECKNNRSYEAQMYLRVFESAFESLPPCELANSCRKALEAFADSYKRENSSFH